MKAIRDDSSVLVPYGLETDGLDPRLNEDVVLLAELLMIHQTIDQVSSSFTRQALAFLAFCGNILAFWAFCGNILTFLAFLWQYLNFFAFSLYTVG